MCNFNPLDTGRKFNEYKTFRRRRRLKTENIQRVKFFKFQMCKTRFTNKFLIDSNAYLKVHVCK